MLDADLTDAVYAELRADGIDPDALFTDENSARDVITRADMAELATAASVVAADGIALEQLEAANVPKRSRKASEHGIDCIGARFDEQGHPTRWQADERVIFCSTKSSLGPAPTAIRRATESIGRDVLTQPRAAIEIRVLKYRLESAGINADRLPLALTEFPDPRKLTFIAVAVGDVYEDDDLTAALAESSPPGLRRLRVIAIPGFRALPGRV